MALSFLSTQPKKRSHIIAIDLGMRNTKAVSLQRKGHGFELIHYTIQDAPAQDKNAAIQVLSEHLKRIHQAVGARGKEIVLIAGVNDTLLRHAEVPMMPIADLRQMLRYGSKNYLQQDLPDYVFDCFLLPPKTSATPATEAAKNPKSRALVGGAKKQFLDQLQEATKNAGLIAEQIAPNLIAPSNAFEMAQPEIFSKEVVALVDIGFKNSTISLLQNGDLSLSRVVSIGSDKLTSGLAESMGVNYAEAERAKLEMTPDAQMHLVPVLMPLGRELRASIDFFEKQEDKTVSQAFISGGAARSAFIIEALQSELMVACKSWNPASFLSLSLPPQQMAEIEQIAPQLTVAIGGAVAAL
jgi:type IV pilus assembly protein PilM